MKRDEAVRLLRQHESELRSLGVLGPYLFGSTARDEADARSDVDLFVDHARGALGLYHLMDIKELARTILRRPADVMTRSSLHPALRAEIESSAVRIF